MVTPERLAAYEAGECVTCRRDVDLLDPIDEANYRITGECPDCIASKSGEEDDE